MFLKIVSLRSDTLGKKIHWPCFLPFFNCATGSRTTSLGFYIEPVIIWLNLTPANFQLTIISSCCTTSSSFFLSWLYFLPVIYQISMKSSSHYLVSETTSKDNSPQKWLEPLRLRRIDFSKEIISNLQTKTSDRAGEFLWGVIFGCGFRN